MIRRPSCLGVRRMVAVAVALMSVAAGCSDDDGASTTVESVVDEAAPSLLDVLATEGAGGLDDLRVGSEGEVSLALVRDGDAAAAYLCDGYAGEWFTGADGEDLHSSQGSTLAVSGDEATITADGGTSFTVGLEAADGDDDLVRFTDDDGVGGLVVHDGVVRGAATRGRSIDLQPTPTLAATTTEPPAPMTVRFDATIEVGEAGRYTTRLDLACVGAEAEISAAYDDIESSLVLVYARLADDLNGEIAALEQQVAADQFERDAISADIAALGEHLAELETELAASLADLAVQRDRALAQAAAACP